MKKCKKDKKVMFRYLFLFAVVILIAISFFPVKLAVYADENDERSYLKQGVLLWRRSPNRIEDSLCIVETSGSLDRPKLKKAGWTFIGDNPLDPSIYYITRTIEDDGYIAQGKSPLLELNSNFDPCKAKNFFAITYEEAYWIEGEKKEGDYLVPIIIYDWTPVYPIRRSGTLASKLLPKGYLTIWDFIGKSAMNTGD